MEKEGVQLNQQNENNQFQSSNDYLQLQQQSPLRSLNTASILRTHTRIQQSSSQDRQDLLKKKSIQTEISSKSNENSHLHMQHHQQVLKHPFSRLFTSKERAFDKNLSSFKSLTTFLNLKKVLQDKGLKMFKAAQNHGQDIKAVVSSQNKETFNNNTLLAREELEQTSDDSRNEGRIQLKFKEVHGREDDSPGGRHSRRLKRQKIIGEALLKKIEQRYKEEKMAHPQNTFLNSLVNSLGQEISKNDAVFKYDETQNEDDHLLVSILEAEKQVKRQYQKSSSFHEGQYKEKDLQNVKIQGNNNRIVKDNREIHLKYNNKDQKNPRNNRISVSQDRINFRNINNTVSKSNLDIKDDDSLIASEIINHKKQDKVDKLQIFHQIYKQETDKLILQAKIKSQRILNKKYLPDKLTELPMKRQGTSSPQIRSISNIFITDPIRFSEKLSLENNNNLNEKNKEFFEQNRKQEKNCSFSELQLLILPSNQKSQRNQYQENYQNQSETSFRNLSQQRSYSQHNDMGDRFMKDINQINRQVNNRFNNKIFKDSEKSRLTTQNVHLNLNNHRQSKASEDYSQEGEGLNDYFKEKQVPSGTILNLGQSQVQGRQNLIKLKQITSNSRNANKFMILQQQESQQQQKSTRQNILLRDDRKNNFSLQSFNSSESICQLEKSPQKRNINSSVLENQIVSLEKIIDSSSALDRVAFKKDFVLLDRMKSISHHFDTRLPDFQLACSIGGVNVIEKPSFLRSKLRKL